VDTDDPINPGHYTKGISAYSYIASWNMGYEAGNIIKYVTRFPYKNPSNPTQDLEKAKWYLEELISRVEREGADDV